MNRTKTPGWSSKSNATPSPKSSSIIFTSTPRWKAVSRVNALAIDHGRPKTLALKDLINCYIEHRREVIIRRTRFELRKAEERAETLEGYLIALANLDEFIRIIRQSTNRDEAKIKLLAFDFTRQQVEHIGVVIRNEARLTSGRYSFSEAQANAILDLRLYQLTGLEMGKVRAEYAAVARTHQGPARYSGQGSPRLRHHQGGIEGD